MNWLKRIFGKKETKQQKVWEIPHKKGDIVQTGEWTWRVYENDDPKNGSINLSYATFCSKEQAMKHREFVLSK